MDVELLGERGGSHKAIVDYLLLTSITRQIKNQNGLLADSNLVIVHFEEKFYVNITTVQMPASRSDIP